MARGGHVEEGGLGGRGEASGNSLTGLEGGELIKGSLYVVVREEWEDDKVFEVSSQAVTVDRAYTALLRRNEGDE